MSDILLHHYWLSPYSEKVRAMLAYKGLAWRSVEQPAMLPKPDQIALTGGYRKAPVMQIGRDIYCDSRLIARVLERLKSSPPLVPPQIAASCAAFAALEQTLFFAAVAVVLQPAGLKVFENTMGADFIASFFKDRAALFTGGSLALPGPEHRELHFPQLMRAIDAQLASGAFVLGDAPTLPDFIVWNAVWFVLANSGVAAQLDAFKNILAWAQRMRALGHGSFTPLASGEALDIARNTSSTQPFDGALLEPEGLKLGRKVGVSATDYGCDVVVGTLVHASAFEVAVKREDPRAAEMVVHFPRNGFRVVAA